MPPSLVFVLPAICTCVTFEDPSNLHLLSTYYVDIVLIGTSESHWPPRLDRGAQERSRQGRSGGQDSKTLATWACCKGANVQSSQGAHSWGCGPGGGRQKTPPRLRWTLTVRQQQT